MGSERIDGAHNRSLEEKIASEIRQGAKGRSDAYVHENYEDAAMLLRSAANRYDELTAQDGKSARHTREMTKLETELREREAAWKAWSALAEERNHLADLAQDRTLASRTADDVRDAAALQRGADASTARKDREPIAPSSRELGVPVPSDGFRHQDANAPGDPIAARAAQTRTEPTATREMVKDFRQLSQAERLRDSRMNAGAKTVAAIDAAIDRKYGPDTPQADRMKRAAREAVAQTLERGSRVPVPRVREAERRREAGAEQIRTHAPDERERDR